MRGSKGGMQLSAGVTDEKHRGLPPERMGEKGTLQARRIRWVLLKAAREIKGGI